MALIGLGFHCPHCGSSTWNGICKGCNKLYEEVQTTLEELTTNPPKGTIHKVTYVVEGELPAEVRQRVYGS